MNIDTLFNIWEYEHSITAAVLGRIPDSKMDFKPHEHAMKSGDLAWHIVRAENMFVRGILRGDYDQRPEFPPRPASIRQVVEIFNENHANLVEQVRALSDADLARRISFRQRWNYPAAMFLVVCIHHEIHHRGQLTEHLRLMGEKVPAIYGPSADEPAPAIAITV